METIAAQSEGKMTVVLNVPLPSLALDSGSRYCIGNNAKKLIKIQNY
jgi:hypothetical protein